MVGPLVLNLERILAAVMVILKVALSVEKMVGTKDNS
jgi:hypothetical protein